MSEFTTLSQIALTRQGNTDGYTYGSTAKGYPKTFVASGDGDVSGFTIVSTELAAYGAADDDFVGMVVQVESSELGAGEEQGAPQRRRIISFDFLTSTFTIEALTHQSKATDRYSLLEDPGGYFVEDTGGAAVTVTDDVNRNEADDYWIGNAASGGPYMVALESALIPSGTQGLVTDFVSLTGAATVVALGANNAVGELFEVMSWPEITGSIGFKQGRVDRGSMVGQVGRLPGVAGLHEISGSLEYMVRGAGTGRIGKPAELDDVLGSVATVTPAQADEAIAAGTTTVSVNVGGAGTIGEMWLTDTGDICVDTDGADPFVPSPTLRAPAPATAAPLYGVRTYGPAEVASWALKAWQWHGRGIRDEFPGILAAPKFSYSLGQFFKCSVALTGAGGKRIYLDHTGTKIARPSILAAKVPSTRPRVPTYGRVNLDDVEFRPRNFELDLGIKVELEPDLNLPDQRKTVTRVDEPTFSLDLFVGSDEKAAMIKSRIGKTMRLLIQVGHTPGFPGVWAFWADRVEITSDDPPGDDAGALTIQLQGRVVLDTTSALGRWLMGMV